MKRKTTTLENNCNKKQKLVDERESYLIDLIFQSALEDWTPACRLLPIFVNYEIEVTEEEWEKCAIRTTFERKGSKKFRFYKELNYGKKHCIQCSDIVYREFLEPLLKNGISLTKWSNEISYKHALETVLKRLEQHEQMRVIWDEVCEDLVESCPTLTFSKWIRSNWWYCSTRA